MTIKIDTKILSEKQISDLCEFAHKNGVSLCVYDLEIDNFAIVELKIKKHCGETYQNSCICSFASNGYDDFYCRLD